MVPPYHQPGAGVALQLLLGLFVVGEYAVQIRGGLALRRGRGGRRAEGRTHLALVFSIVVGVAGAIVLAYHGDGRISVVEWPLYGLGIALMIVGIAVRWWSIAMLGAFFTPVVRVHSDQTVVDRGPYRWVRHPSYTGLLLVCAGLGLALTDWLSLLLVVALPAAGLALRIRAEEQVLLGSLGTPYAEFCATRPRLIPRLRNR